MTLVTAFENAARAVEHATAYAQRKGWTVDPAQVYVDDGMPDSPPDDNHSGNHKDT